MATFTGTKGTDTFIGTRPEQDLFRFLPGNLSGTDTVDGGAGFGNIYAPDTLEFYGAGAISRDQLAGVTNIEVIRLGVANISIELNGTIGGEQSSTIVVEGSAGKDTVLAGNNPGGTFYRPGSGNDSFFGSGGTDQISINVADLTSSDTFKGEGGQDVLYFASSGSLAAIDALQGVTGFESIYLNAGGNDIWLDEGTVGSVDLFSVTGGAGDDYVSASRATSNVFFMTGEGSNFFSGGSGDDQAIGGSGRDSFIGYAGDDLLFGGGGNDLLSGDEGDDGLYGQEGYDELVGGNGNDTLDGGSGADYMVGGAGNDTFVVDNAADVVIERAGAGHDVVQAAASYRLGASAEIEELQTTDLFDTGGIDLLGNNYAQAISGNAGANVLKGLGGNDALSGGAGNDRLHGGAGMDTLNGGLGNDSFVFDTALSLSSIDTIQDFANASGNNDRMLLDDAVFTALTSRTLSADQFLDNNSDLATSVDHRVIYNQSTGALFYDADGAGGADGVQFATLINNADLGLSDFVIV